MDDYLNTEQSTAVAPATFPVLRGLIRRKRAVTMGGATAIVLLVCWLAARTGFPELYLFALLIGGAAYGVLLAAIEVVELVAETLMPR